MKLKIRTAVLSLVNMIIIAAIVVSGPGCMAGGNQPSCAAVQNANLQMSPYKGPLTAPVVITVFSDFQ